MKRISLITIFLGILIILGNVRAILAQEPITPLATQQAETSTDTPAPPPTEVIAQDTPPTETPTSTATFTPIPTPTETPTPTPTNTATPTVTPFWPTDTPTPTPVWTATPVCADALEPNDQPGAGPALLMGQVISNLTLYPQGDIDFFVLWGKGGAFYQITTTTSESVDTRLRVFDPTGALVAENDDYTPGNPASRVVFMAPGEGWFAVAVDSRAPLNWDCRQYTVTAIDVSPPTATPTATPGPSPTPTRTVTPTGTVTPVPAEVAGDKYEPNYDFSTATNLGVNQTLNLNFNPYPPGSNAVDNDFFQIYVKVGDQLRFETTNLAEGLDTNLILYRDNGQVIAGNDDCVAGQRYSCLDWAPDYTGLAYLLAGPVGTIPPAIAAGARAYNLVVKNMAGQAATPAAGGSAAISSGNVAGAPTPGRDLPWAVTPLPPPTLTATPALAGQSLTATLAASQTISAAAVTAVEVRPFSLIPPTATPLPLQAVTVQLTVYYDENNNRSPDTNEGVAGLSVRALDGLTNQALGQTFTDGYGHATLAVSAAGEVRLSVPYLGYNQPLKAPGKILTLRLEPRRLPSLIP